MENEIKKAEEFGYKVLWNQKIDKNSAVDNYFVTHVGKETNYWKPFKFGRTWYLVTFENIYRVEI